jgi:hypothetical protein
MIVWNNYFNQSELGFIFKSLPGKIIMGSKLSYFSNTLLGLSQTFGDAANDSLK